MRESLRLSIIGGSKLWSSARRFPRFPSVGNDLADRVTMLVGGLGSCVPLIIAKLFGGRAHRACAEADQNCARRLQPQQPSATISPDKDGCWYWAASREPLLSACDPAANPPSPRLPNQADPTRCASRNHDNLFTFGVTQSHPIPQSVRSQCEVENRSRPHWKNSQQYGWTPQIDVLFV